MECYLADKGGAKQIHNAPIFNNRRVSTPIPVTRPAPRRQLKITGHRSVPAQQSRASPAAPAHRNHGGDNRGDLRERGHPQGGPHEPQDRGGEDHTTVYVMPPARPRDTNIAGAGAGADAAPAHITDNTFDSEHRSKHP
ncbi:unnamed protein product [Diatraea saccharalis]|uniref:Uncharacterized protein n=1 Tax=Diatraea saccharalis TaxID=40085 RepID=A0A9N9RFL3_9NEOP|nr:unnamed protein product [Diatraea saccharalis]